MKRLMLLLLPLLLFLSLPFVARSQSTLEGLIEEEESTTSNDSVPPQRIGVPPAPSGLDLSANESGSLTGYCFDEYLIAPRKVTRFENVLAGNDDAVVHMASGRRMTLKDAIAEKKVSVKAMQLRVMFTNLSGEPLSIELPRAVVLWDRPGGDVNPTALKVIESDNGDYESQQNEVWRYTTAERLLAVLGYYEGSVWNIDRERMNKAAAEFQRASGIASSGEIDNMTATRLATVSYDLQNRLRNLGFRDRDGRSLKEDLTAQIRAYQKYIGRTPNGKWSPELASRLTTDERIVPQLKDLRTAGKSVGEVLGDEKAHPNVLTYLNAQKKLMVLMDTPQGIELWSRRGSSFQFEKRDLQAVHALDQAAAELAVRGSKENRVVIYPHITTDGMVTIGIGDRNIQIDEKSLRGYLKGGEIPAALAGALTPLLPTGDATTGARATPQLVVYRGPLVQGRDGTASVEKLGVRQIDGAELATALKKSYGDRADLYLSSDLRIGAQRV